MSVRRFRKGETIEVIRENDHSKPSYFPATVLRSPSKTRSQIFVEFQTLMAGDENERLRELVDAVKVRPVQPLELTPQSFNLCEIVDAFHTNAWRQGAIVGLFLNSKYLVLFDDSDERIEFHRSNLRLHREWHHQCWVPPLDQQQQRKSTVEVKSKGGVKLKIKYSGRPLEAKFSKGTMVEVKSDEEGYQGSWYTAVIVDLIGDDKFLVEYQTLKTDNEAELIKQIADGSCIRPCPPEIRQIGRFEQVEEVDAWYNDGWWVGHISEVLDDFQYGVCFSMSNENRIFEHSELRPHQEWIDNEWATASRRRSTDLEPKSRDVKLKIKCRGRKLAPRFTEGTIVEIKSDEDGYHGSWYTAVVVGSIGNDKFLVEYLTLKTDDESKLLRENADASYIRPCPPDIQRVDRFKLLEEVDAWYNDGWWLGLISRVLGGLKYAVYFWTTNEILEVGHFDLRPHQEWINGKWIVAFMQKAPAVPVKPRPGKLTGQYGRRPSEPVFSNGTKVEVKSNEEGYLGSWYPGIIVSQTGNGKYLVEFQTLKADNPLELLKEEADVLCIRPCPPVTQQKDPFKADEEVDAWYNYGWCVGHVCCKYVEGSNYSVFIRNMNKALEFQHSNLRPHREWMDGQWVVASTGCNLMITN